MIAAFVPPDPRVWMLAGAAVGAWLLAWLVTTILRCGGIGSASLHHELLQRLRTWAVIIPAAVVPVALGTPGLAVAIPLLGAICFREFGRIASIGRDPGVRVPVLVGLAAVGVAIAQQDHRLLLQCGPIVTLVIAAAALFGDQPHGYLRRVALGCLGFTLCGLWLGHLGFLAVDGFPATWLLWTLLCVELNDVFAYTAGKCLGRRPLCPRTSPNKTWGGLVGGAAMTTAFATLSGCWIFAGHPLGHPGTMIPLGILIATAGATGDLILSAIKRDLRVKDTSAALPGHGGLLDRFDSLLFAAPVISIALRLLANGRTLPMLP